MFERRSFLIHFNVLNKKPSNNDKLPKFSVSTLAHSLHYNCKKQIYLLSSTRDTKQGLEYTIADSLFERGNDFEKELCNRHASFIVDHTYSKDFLQVLRDAQPGKYLYQLRVTIPDSFYTDVLHIDNYRMNNFIPDFLYIHKEDPKDKKRKLRIIDAKSSRQVTTSHQFQVASYALFLKYIIKDIPDLEIDDVGGVWLPSNMDNPVQFRIGLVMNTVKHIYTTTLPEILKDTNPEWKLNKSCSSCYFYKQCKTDAEGTLQSIPYYQSDDIEDLSDLLQNLKIEKKEDDAVVHYVQAYSLKQPRFLGYPSVLIAKETDHSIYIYLQMDLYTLTPFVYGIHVTDSNNNPVFESSYTTPYTKNTESASEFADRFIRDLQHVLDDMAAASSRCLFYIYDESEKTTLQNYLYQLVDSDGKQLITLSKERQEEIVKEATQLLIALFQDSTQLLNLSDLTMIQGVHREATVGRFVSIEKLLAQNVALGISGHYPLKDVVPWMTQPKDDWTTETSPDKIYDHWRRNSQETESLMARRFGWLKQIMETYWQLAETQDLPLACAPFQWPELQPVQSPLIAKLLLFKQLECFKACDETRMDRIRDLPNSRMDSPYGLVLDLESVEKTEISAYVWKLTLNADPEQNGPLLQQKLDNLAMNTMRQYILVPDTKEVSSMHIVYKKEIF